MRRRLSNSIWRAARWRASWRCSSLPSPIAPGTHPCDFAFSPDEKTLYVALSNRDAVAAVNVSGGQFSVKGYFDTRLPGQSYFGAEPVALAVNGDGSRLYVANMGTDSVAVFDTSKLTPRAAKNGMVEPDGFIPTEWMPISMAFLSSTSGGKLYLATDKGKGTGPNNFPPRRVETAPSVNARANAYIGTLLYGSLATLDEKEIASSLSGWTATVLAENRMKAAQEKIVFAARQRSHSARHLHHQGKSHLRSDPRRPGAGRETRGQRRTQVGDVRRIDHAQRAQAGPAIRRARQLLRLRRSFRRRPRLVQRGHRHGLSGEDLAASATAARSALTITKAWWPTAIRCCRRFPT